MYHLALKTIWTEYTIRNLFKKNNVFGVLLKCWTQFVSSRKEKENYDEKIKINLINSKVNQSI